MLFLNEESKNSAGNGQGELIKKEWRTEQKRKINEAMEVAFAADQSAQEPVIETALQLIDKALFKAEEWNLKSEQIGLWELKSVFLRDLGFPGEARDALNMSLQVMARR